MVIGSAVSTGVNLNLRTHAISSMHTVSIPTQFYQPRYLPDNSLIKVHKTCMRLKYIIKANNKMIIFATPL